MRSYHFALALVSLSGAAEAAVPTVTLNNGVEMPMMFLGTTMNFDGGNETEINVRKALKIGWNAIDTALNYGNQENIARALVDVERSSVFVNTKIGGAMTQAGTVATAYNFSMHEAYINLQQLNLDYVDMVLIHNPPKSLGVSDEDACPYMQEEWRALEDFMKRGKARAIGVSNFCQSDLACILETATVVPAVNQVMFHVGMSPDPRGLVSYNDALGIQTMAYEPLGAMDYTTWTRDISLITGDFTRNIGQLYGKSGAQVALRWVIQHGIPLATASSSEKHLQQNLDVFEFALDDTDMQQLNAATKPSSEPNGFFVDIPTCGSEALAATV